MCNMRSREYHKKHKYIEFHSKSRDKSMMSNSDCYLCSEEKTFNWIQYEGVKQAIVSRLYLACDEREKKLPSSQHDFYTMRMSRFKLPNCI